MIISSRSRRVTNSVGIFSLALGVALLLGACDMLSCNDKRERVGPQNAARWVEQTHVAQFIPKTARTVVFSRDLPTLTEALRFGSARLPSPDLGAATDAWGSATGIDPLDDEALEKLGLDTARPAAVFYDRGFWSIAAQIEKPEVFEQALEAASQRESIEARETDFGPMSLVKLSLVKLPLVEPSVDDHTVFVAYDQDSVLISVHHEPSALHTDTSTLPDAWLPQSTKRRFVEAPDHRSLLREMTTVGEIIAVVRPSAWLAGQRASGQAGVLLARILDQVGPVGIAASSVSLEKSVRVRVLTPGNKRAPAMITSLGQADGDIPSLGGIIAPGVLGVARLSVSPRQLYELLSSGLPAAQRQEVSAFWDELDRELRINAQRDVLENLRGHAIVVAYGLDRDGLEASKAPWYLDVVKLDATREAVLLPIKEREPLEQVLNALTTVSKGKLTRQEVGHTLQYAWLDDGQLKWAVILSDENLIYVDSSVAFEHAVEYERGAGPLGEQIEEAGITRIFDDRAAAGVYLDTASLTNMLAEAGSEHAKGWITPFRTAIVTTRDEDGVGVTDIELEISPVVSQYSLGPVITRPSNHPAYCTSRATEPLPVLPKASTTSTSTV
jgi:hypothetical protein